MAYPVPENELQRLKALQELQILDSARQPDFDSLVVLAQELFDVPISMISTILSRHQQAATTPSYLLLAGAFGAD
jgi:hypothetical protein